MNWQPSSDRQTKLFHAFVLSIPLFTGLCIPAAAQLSLAEAEKISAETGRTMFVVAGKKT